MECQRPAVSRVTRRFRSRQREGSLDKGSTNARVRGLLNDAQCETESLRDRQREAAALSAARKGVSTRGQIRPSRRGG